ncbi:hypothetical protein Q5692_34820 [Microcoleus sp. C2C3]
MMEQIDYNFSKSEKAKGTQKRAPLSATGFPACSTKDKFACGTGRKACS